MTLSAMDYISPALDESYADFIVRHDQNVGEIFSDFSEDYIQRIVGLMRSCINAVVGAQWSWSG